MNIEEHGIWIPISMRCVKRTADRRNTCASWRAQLHLNRISGGRRVYNGHMALETGATIFDTSTPAKLQLRFWSGSSFAWHAVTVAALQSPPPPRSGVTRLCSCPVNDQATKLQGQGSQATRLRLSSYRHRVVNLTGSSYQTTRLRLSSYIGTGLPSY